MKSYIFLLLFILSISTQFAHAHSFTTYISADFFDVTAHFLTQECTTPETTAATISQCGLELEKAMTSSFTRARRLSQLTITTNLSKYTTRIALQRAATSCIQAQTACGFAEKHPVLAGWEVVSPRCNPESTTEDGFVTWFAKLTPAQQKIITKLEALMNTVITANFAVGTYSLSAAPRRSPRKK